MIRKLEYILLLSFLILFSCNEGNRSNMKLASPMEEMDSSHLKKSLLHEVRKFVGKQTRTRCGCAGEGSWS